VSRLEALLRPLLETVMDDAIQSRRQARVRLQQIGGIVLEDGVHRLGRGVPLEGAAPRQHLVENGPEGEDVGTLVGGEAADLLGDM
jgi:hypothetical protein